MGKITRDQGKAEDSEEYFASAGRLGKKDANIIALIGEAYLKMSES